MNGNFAISIFYIKYHVIFGTNYKVKYFRELHKSGGVIKSKTQQTVNTTIKLDGSSRTDRARGAHTASLFNSQIKDYLLRRPRSIRH